jgi:cysteine-rich repeat protein
MVWFTSGCTSPKSALDRAEMSVSRATDSDHSSDASVDAGEADGSKLDTGKGDPVDAGDARDESDASDSMRATDLNADETGDEPRCGDGKVSGNERCDTAIEAGNKGACPTSCESASKMCESIALVGSECDARCQYETITERAAGDMCCPSGANAADDRDCAAICGNGVTEPGETCDPPDSCPTCPASTACLRVTATGKPQECNRGCESTPVVACASNDGCCPSGCTPQNDSDCSARCGDGVVDTRSGETCEPGSATPCPDNCHDTDPCSDDVLTGSAANCNVACVHVSITRAYNGDGCCWMGANANGDSDCAPVCGNGVVERNEGCDDGNTRPGDGCNASCVRETAMQMCLAGREGDSCAQCTCDNCRTAAASCRADGSGSDARCDALAQCMLRSRCSGLECYCGSDLVGCLTGGANGPCEAQIEAATGTNNVLEIVTQLTLSDNSSPLGRAQSLATCERNQCEDECGR